MSYSASDFADDVFAECVRVGLVSQADADQVAGDDDPSRAADLVLRALARLPHASKAGIRRIKVKSLRAPLHAARMLALLRDARDCARSAGACYTLARIRYAISSAKGAVRAAQYRGRA